MSCITDWTFIGPRIELTLSPTRVCKDFMICHSNGTSCNLKTKLHDQSPRATTERPPLVGEVIANVLPIEGATWSA
jgi:hypothetical protein